ncbi:MULTISPECIES: hypothetical protein [unclassified Bradyrhizobium]|uniref:hypothetical protein n=1 Tax=unclassified Bradyrhizobium TaxID=2631580 RepID=UPI0028E68DCE|nr:MULTISPECIES: hypothetical protein [unclassified Bradyrhizobium]
MTSRIAAKQVADQTDEIESSGRSLTAQAKVLVTEWKAARASRGRFASTLMQSPPASDDVLMERAFTLMTKSNTEQVRLKFLRTSMEIGSVRSLRARVARWDAFFSASPSDAVLEEFQAIKATLDEMSEVERTHGIGALLNLNHPVVIGLSQRPGSWIGPQEIQNARSYQRLSGGVSLGVHSSTNSSIEANG